MITITLKTEYEKVLLVLALRQFATSELTKAVREYTSDDDGSITKGREFSARGNAASEIANRIG